MPRIARRSLATLLIALHAAISACGPGLHAAPGLGHASTTPAGLEAGRRDESSGGRSTISADSSEHCPLCDFFAQGQLLAGSTSPAPSDAASPCRSPRRPEDPLRASDRSSRPRAPPLASRQVI